MGECRRRMMTEVHHPYDAEVEYIQNTGSQCIVTEYVPTGDNIKIQGKFTPVSYSANYAPWFSAYTNESADAYRIIRGNNSNTTVYFTCGSKASSSGSHIISLNTTYVFELMKTGLTLNDSTKTITPSSGTTNTNKLAIFSNFGKSSFTRGKLYYFRVWDGDVLVFDFIPVRVGTVGYMYDKVSGVLFGNSGTESFTVGPDTVVYKSAYDSEIEYLQSTGEQYIDTGIIPDNDTGIQIVYYPSMYNHLNANDFFIVGSRNNTSNTRWCIGKSGQEAVAFYYGYGIYNHAPNQNQYNRKYIVALNYKNNKLLEVKDVAANNQTQQRTLSNLSFTPQYNIRLFGAAGVDANYTKASGRLYSVMISQGDKIIMNLIPVRVGNTGYMYDKISKQLFGNNGTGSFVLGADKH